MPDPVVGAEVVLLGPEGEGVPVLAGQGAVDRCPVLRAVRRPVDGVEGQPTRVLCRGNELSVSSKGGETYKGRRFGRSVCEALKRLAVGRETALEGTRFRAQPPSGGGHEEGRVWVALKRSQPTEWLRNQGKNYVGR